jgi:hypothetical protein
MLPSNVGKGEVAGTSFHKASLIFKNIEIVLKI